MIQGSNQINLLVVLGPTASGKTSLGVRLAREFGGEIISADSRQVYRGMDSGTGKDLHEYGEVPYHLIDILDPLDEFSLFHFQRECLIAMENIISRDRLPFLVGGTGLYLESVLRGYRLVDVPECRSLREELDEISLDKLRERLQKATATHNTTDTLDPVRLYRAIEIAEFQNSHEPEPLPEIRPLILGIRWERTVLRKRITERLKDRMARGMIEEVQGLHDSGIPWERLDYFGLEYRFIARHLRGEMNRNDLFQRLNSAIHEFAKKQDNWFRRMERNGIVIHWLDGDIDPFDRATELLERSGIPRNVG